jgi:hypothetical protein
MLSCGATFDENSVPPWTRGDFRGVFERGNKPSPALRDRWRRGSICCRRTPHTNHSRWRWHASLSTKRELFHGALHGPIRHKVDVSVEDVLFTSLSPSATKIW